MDKEQLISLNQGRYTLRAHLNLIRIQEFVKPVELFARKILNMKAYYIIRMTGFIW